MEIGSPLSEAELCPPHLLLEQEEAFARDIKKLRRHAQDFVVVSCPACESYEAEQILVKNGFRTLECRRCRTWYTSPRPTPEHLSEYYQHSENYEVWANRIFPQSEQARREKIGEIWLQRLKDLSVKYETSRGIYLEVGPGFGTFADLVSKSRFFDQVLVVEPTPGLIEACRQRGLSVIDKAIEEVTDEDLPSSVSIVATFEVIEHLFSPAIFLKQLRRVLTGDSLLVLSCPNAAGFDIQELKEQSLAVDAEHLNLFTPHGIKLLLERNDFQVLEVATPGRLDAEFVRDAALAEKITLDRFLRNVLVDNWTNLGWLFQKFLAENNLSSHMWVVARPAAS